MDTRILCMPPPHDVKFYNRHWMDQKTFINSYYRENFNERSTVVDSISLGHFYLIY
ncbi:unnamed protein product [Acanthoscelides obtectus]|uniref:Uncharacterized protein n=1 Tax=Acanthoscelides obtectus TaxID=200917 RepID=A0A9P0LW51_ACAOB|nr:unnamed protein product [Acanthoscelides obtectus]CAK1674239.1 hypothetical protein AOBTE_LOCUS29562 [Acanthoscelides obtectus]